MEYSKFVDGDGMPLREKVTTNRLRHVPLFPATFNPSLGLCVEGYLHDCWWPGEIVEVNYRKGWRVVFDDGDSAWLVRRNIRPMLKCASQWTSSAHPNGAPSSSSSSITTTSVNALRAAADASSSSGGGAGLNFKPATRRRLRAGRAAALQINPNEATAALASILEPVLNGTTAAAASAPLHLSEVIRKLEAELLPERQYSWSTRSIRSPRPSSS